MCVCRVSVTPRLEPEITEESMRIHGALSASAMKQVESAELGEVQYQLHPLSSHPDPSQTPDLTANFTPTWAGSS